MMLEGVVTNVAAFGAFVDIGVHQDGLVHVSAMSTNFVKDPRDVVKPGDIVRVKVLDVDIPRKRISLTLRLDDDPAQSATGGPRADTAQSGGSAEGGRRPRGRGDGERAGAGGQRGRGDGAQRGRGDGGQRGRGDGPQRDGQRDGGQRGRGDAAQRDGGQRGRGDGAQRDGQRDGGQRQRGGGQRGGGQRRAEPSGAMAEALRKAGLTGDKS